MEKKNELSNFSRLLNASAWITFWTLYVQADFVFHLFNVSLRFRDQSAKQRVCDLPYSVSNIFRIVGAKTYCYPPLQTTSTYRQNIYSKHVHTQAGHGRMVNLHNIYHLPRNLLLSCVQTPVRGYRGKDTLSNEEKLGPWDPPRC